LGQTSSQKIESEDANKIIDETLIEINMISDEKKQLMLQWKTAISGLSRRDEALAQALKTLANAENAVHDYDMEIESAKRNQQNEQGKHETLVNIKDRLENELNWVEESLTKISIERDQLQERFSLLNKSLMQTTSESKKVELISKQLSIDAETILQNLQVVTLERQKLEEDLQLNIVTNSNVNKSVLNLVKDQNKILKKIHEIENDINSIENEKARVRVEILSLTSVVDQLKNQFNVVQKDLQAKENLIEKYQIEIKQRTDEIEKKIYRVDRLNKKYDKMVESSGGEENLGPMENTIRNLNKEIEAINSECKSFEIDWLKKQTELVSVASQVEILFDANNELQARVTILNQQQLRLSNDLRFLKSEVKSSSLNNIELQKDVSKLNTLINSSQEKEGELQNNNYSLELTCLEELKDLERESVNLQATINEVKLSKNKMLDQIIDEERQALLWEKKIQLDKETREALDPSVGQDRKSVV
jgi:chromosome segregation ATPase